MPPVRAFFLAALLCAAGPLRAAVLREAKGLVQVRPAGSEDWGPAGGTPRKLSEGDGLRTGFNAQARLEFDGGTIVETAGNAHLSVEAEAPGRLSLNALFGRIRLMAAATGRTVSVRTPTCLVRARGERVTLRVTVGGGGGTVVEVEKGVAGVEDNKGRSVQVAAGQRIDVDLAGVHEPSAAPSPAQARRNDFLEMMRRELGFELARASDFDAAARETRREEHQLGRVLTDSDGRRVRVEEYVVRPAANRLSLVVMNGRPQGLSYYAWKATFDSALPVGLQAVFAGLRGGASASPWTVTDFTATLSDGTNSLVEAGSGGHQADVNANGDPLDDVAGGGTAFRTLFDRFGLYANGVLKRGWSGVNITGYADATASSLNDPLTGAALGAALPVVVINTTFPDAGAARRSTLESYGDGTSILREQLSLEFGGGTAPRSSLGSPDLNDERRASFGGASIRVVLPSAAADVTRQLP